MASKYDVYSSEIDSLLKDGKTPTQIASMLLEKLPEGTTHQAIRYYIKERKRKIQPDEIKGRFQLIDDECEKVGIPSDSVKYAWYKGEGISMFFKKEYTFQQLKEEIIDSIKEYAPKYPTIIYPKYEDGHLLVIDPADIHLNKLCSAFETGDAYTIEIAVNRVKEGVAGILRKAAPYSVDKIMLIIGNDILHTDNARSQTTSGTPQDTQLMWYDAFLIGKKLLIEVIEMLLTLAPVHVQYDPSNHDYMTGFLLAQTIEAWFSRVENITFNVSIAHRKYYRYGNSLIGTSHGDGAKETDLALLMAHESEHWQSCKHRYFYIHHIHHKKSKDYMSVCVEALRSASGTDSWHHRQGFQHSPKAIEGFLHHKEHGQIARFTHLF
jgi:hypothetical protein